MANKGWTGRAAADQTTSTAVTLVLLWPDSGLAAWLVLSLSAVAAPAPALPAPALPAPAFPAPAQHRLHSFPSPVFAVESNVSLGTSAQCTGGTECGAASAAGGHFTTHGCPSLSCSLSLPPRCEGGAPHHSRICHWCSGCQPCTHCWRGGTAVVRSEWGRRGPRLSAPLLHSTPPQHTPAHIAHWPWPWPCTGPGPALALALHWPWP